MPESQERARQFARILRVLQILDQSRYGRTTTELRDEVVDVMGLTSLTTKSIERDIRALQDQGYPIERISTGDGRRRKVWKLDRAGFLRIPDLPISVVELLSFAAGRELLYPLAGTPYWEGIESLWRKMRDSLSEDVWQHFEKQRPALVVRGPALKSYADREGQLSALNRAIQQHRVVEVAYQSAGSQQAAPRLVHPYAIVIYGNSLYLLCARDGHSETDADAWRSYKLDRMSRVALLDRRFAPRDDFDADSLLSDSIGVFSSGTPRRFVIRIGARCAAWAVESPFHPAQEVTHLEDGSVQLEIPTAYSEEILPRLLSLGVDAELLEPADCRDRLRETAMRLASLYAADSSGPADAPPA